MVIPSYRIINLAQAVGSAGLIVIAIAYFQNFLGLEPCYLCVTQRVFVIAALHNPPRQGQRWYAGTSFLAAAVGAYFSGKQLWLQSLPEDQVPACGVPVDYLFDSFSASEAIGMLLRGDGNCAEVQWQLLGLSMPGWVMVAFASFAVLGAVQFLRKS